MENEKQNTAPGTQFDVQEMLRDLDGGTLENQLATAIHEVAKSVVFHGEGNRKGKVTLELNIEAIKGASQVRINHKLTYKQLTKRGDKTETRSNDAPMHVTRTGVSSTPDGQIDLIERLRNGESA